MSDGAISMVVALVAVTAMILLFSLVLGIGWLGQVVTGADGRTSTSKFQFFVWTGVIIWAYAATFWSQYLTDGSLGELGVPDNLFILMGLSATTAVAAKAVRVGETGSTLLDQGQGGFRWAFLSDDGRVALEKVQVMSWTLIAVGVYVITVTTALSSGSMANQLPDIDTNLLVLMGLSQAGYIAAKGISKHVGSDAL
jgi:hypothetical protein